VGAYLELSMNQRVVFSEVSVEYGADDMEPIMKQHK
jgi:hypothetical protein